MYNTSGVNETVDFKRLRPGIENKVVIENIMGFEPGAGRSPYLEFNLRKPEATAEDGTRLRFYMSEKSTPMSMKKIIHIATKCIKRSSLDAIKADSLEEYGAMLNKLLRNRSLRIMFSPEEYKNAKGVIGIKPGIGLPDFAEAINEGAEYPAVADNATKLVYDQDKLRIKLREGSAPTTEEVVVKDDLPF